MIYGDPRLIRASWLETEAKLLRKEVERDNILSSQGPMSGAFKRVSEEVSKLRDTLRGVK